MNLAILGTGAIGSTFAFQLVRAGHTVTVVARGKRLEQLRAEGAIVRVDGERAAVQVVERLDPQIAYDRVLVTVLAPQVAAVLPDLQASRAAKVMFMFNTFDSLRPLEEAVGAPRFAFGFPAGVFCLLKEGRIRPTLRGGTTASDAAWADLFTQAGIPTAVCSDMPSWLRTHAALVAPLMAMGVATVRNGRPLTWAEAGPYAAGLTAGFGLVEELGHTILPRPLGVLGHLPHLLGHALCWAWSRTTLNRELGELGDHEPRMLIDMMSAAAPGRVPKLLAIRP